MPDYKYRFSVITAVYKVELFVAETIESLIAQDIGFENVQLILVDDGSPDKSGAICDSYAAKYPNITVIHKENGGVSSARNAGLDAVEGKYVNFLDSDDKLTPDTLKKVWNFFEKHYDETDVVAIPMRFFDGRTGNHVLNYKFEGKSRIVDLNEEWNFIQLSMSSTFVKSEALKGLYFDSRLAYAEDAQVMQKILINKQALGVVTDTEYMYRRRSQGEKSAIQNSVNNPKWYIPYMKYFQQEVLNYTLERCYSVPKFIQFTLMYDLQWRFKRPELPYEILSEEEIEEYLGLLKYMLQYFDDDVIMAQKNITREYKIFVLELKHQKQPEITVLNNDIIYSFSEYAKFKFSKCKANIDFIKIENNTLMLDGFVSVYSLPYKSLKITLWINGEAVDCQPVERNHQTFALGKEISSFCGFTAKIPLDKAQSYNIKVGADVDGVQIVFKRMALRYFVPISTVFAHSYCHMENWIVSISGNSLCFNKATVKRRIAREFKFLLELFIRNDYKSRAAVFQRLFIKLYRIFKRKPVWLISDRASIAGDNGEAFFRYMCEKQRGIDARFVLLPQSEDFARIAKIGKVVKKDSFKHKILALISEYIISSHAENEIYNPWGIYNCSFKDIWGRCKFVFLQHGITQNDVSNWLGKYNKNFYGLIAAANPEYQSFLNEKYRYTKDNIWFTGFPRYDRLYDDSKKKITIMPTWRRYLADSWNPDTDLWTLIPDFEQSAFFNFYNSLLNDGRLIGAAKKYGYEIVFFPHPTLQPHLDRFLKNDNVTYSDAKKSYREIYAESDLILTDYSSAAFDFSYLCKPILYAQFDKEEFFGGEHIAQKGYFDYERDGFGEVEYDLDGTVNRIIEYMENGCKLKDKYRERIDNFFAFNDKNNCERLYNRLIQK